MANGDTEESPVVSLIITVHNEEARIQEKLDNTLEIDFPKDQLEVIVASDFSTDSTDGIIESYSDCGIRLIRTDERRGKEYAQLCAIRASRGEVLVFSDVATYIPHEALRLLVNKFKDKRIGAVSSEDKLTSNDGQIVGEGVYVRYEMWLRQLESNRSGLVGLSGSFFAARREVCENWDIYSPSDFITAINCVKQGYVAISSPDVVGIYRDLKNPDLEYNRKKRTVIRGMTAILRHPEVLSPLRMGWFSFQLWSHKLMRWGVPWFMLTLMISTVLLRDRGFIYQLMLYAQIIFYSIAVAGWFSETLRRISFVRLIIFFVYSNVALASALVEFLKGKRMTVWAPTRR